MGGVSWLLLFLLERFGILDKENRISNCKFNHSDLRIDGLQKQLGMLKAQGALAESVDQLRLHRTV